MKILLLVLGLCLIGGSTYGQADWKGFNEDSVQSTLDEHWQHFYYLAAQQPHQPLVVVLHTWSGDYTQQQNSLAKETRAKGWNYLHPDFRGQNNHFQACGSPYVIEDIDQAINWALENLPIDPDSIFVVGASGGGYATLVAYMKSRHRIRGFHAYVPISDLAAWYHESLVRNPRYARDVLMCTQSSDSILRVAEAKSRSPLYWATPWAQRQHTALHLYAGAHDGYTGSVPITHSINFYNKVLQDVKVEEAEAYVDDQTIIQLLTRRAGEETGKRIGERKVHLQKNWGPFSLTIFEGGHEMLENVALDLL